MSDHLDGLTPADDPRLDITDVYLFRRTGSVLVLNINPSGTDGFHPEAAYELKLDLDGDAREDLALRVTFGDHDEQGRQPTSLVRLTGDDAADPDAAGTALTRTRTGEAVTADDGTRLWAGVAADPFFVEGGVVTAVRTAVTTGGLLDLSAHDPEHPTDLFDGATVHAIVVELPDDQLPGDEIGFWGSVTVPTDAGDRWRQVDRAAIPLVSTLFGFDEDDGYNGAHPAHDDRLWGAAVQDMVAGAVRANGTHGDPEGYAATARAALLPDVLPYRPGTPARFGEGRRNGRDLTESSPEEVFRLVLNRPVPMGLDRAGTTGAPAPRFPYLDATG